MSSIPITVEYAMEAISHAGIVLGVLATDGVVLAAEKKVTGKLLDLSSAKDSGTSGGGEKIFLLNRYASTRLLRDESSFEVLTHGACACSNVIAGVAGFTADANSLVNYARTAAQRHLFSYNEDIPVEQLAQRLCDLKQGYTQYGGLHPSSSYLILVLMVFLTQVFGRSAYHSSMLATIRTTSSSYTTPIHQGITADGRQPALAPTTAPHKAC